VRSWSRLITLTAIPLSLALTVLVFSWFGLGVNSMTLGGLAVAIGMVVDDAIVDVENVFRRLRENANLAVPKPRLEVIARASNEVRSSILYATTLIILVFVPLLALSGVEGRLFAPIAWATMISMAASFLVSMTVTTALSYFLLDPKPGVEHQDGRLVRGLKSLYRATALRVSLDQPSFLLAGVVALLVATFFAYRQMGGNFLPPFREPTTVIAMAAAPGTSLKTTTELTRAALDQVLKVPGVRTASFRAGRAERGDHVVPVSTVEFDVEFEPMDAEARGEVIQQLREVMRNIPGTFSAFSGPLADRIGHMLSGVSAKIAVKIFGPDVDELRRFGERVIDIAREVPGLHEAQLEPQAAIPQLRIEVDRERALAYGVTPGNLNEELAALMGGETVGAIYDNDRSYDLVVRLPPAWRENPDRLRNLYVHTLNGSSIPLS
jgi:Cu/Ag efflux pump CusA